MSKGGRGRRGLVLWPGWPSAGKACCCNAGVGGTAAMLRGLGLPQRIESAWEVSV